MTQVLVSSRYLGYETSRTHSIMRIATTASPVSGAEVRDRTVELAKIKRLQHSKTKMLSLIKSRRRKLLEHARENEIKMQKKKEREAMLGMMSPEQRSAMVLKLIGDDDELGSKTENLLTRLGAMAPHSHEDPQ